VAVARTNLLIASTAVKDDKMTIKKCYFSINESGIKANLDLLKVAIYSCAEYAKLHPVLLYAGDPVPELDQLRFLGAEIIHHTITFENDLAIGYGDNYKKFLGHWLRVDIPLIESHDEYVVYADCDILFRQAPNVDALPFYLSAAPEFSKNNWSYFNSGSMIINIPNMRDIYPKFVQSIRNRLRNDFKTPPHDQGSFNEFFGDKYDRLPLEMNWKPYWGQNLNASMIHFHGLKPAVAIRAQTIPDYKLTDNIRRLWEKNKPAYAEYTAEYIKILEESEALLSVRLATS
tara:strand:+ start:861 stop:1724 length:864 start_codon:yes stop_codon:yes gene_type:complete